MPRLTRKNIKVFAGSATNNGVFGSLQANNPTTTSDVEQLQSLSAWSDGWNAATETSEELPPLEEIQGVEYVTTYQQAYIMQEGVPEWAATVTYYKGCLTKEVTSTGFKIYNSLTDNNTGNLLSDTSNWKKVMDSDDLYAFDNTVVHKTGNETVAGVKTFSSSPMVPTATSGDSSTKAANTEFVSGVSSDLQTQINAKAANNAVVHLTGDETVSGSKTFTNKITLQERYPYINNKCSDATKGTALSQYRHSGFMFTDKDLKELAGLVNVYDTDKSTYSEIRAYVANSASDTGYSYIRVGKSANGNAYTVAPASDVNNSIVTTVAKNKAANGYFKLGNGLIIQWGRSNQRTITYPIPFSSDTSFSIVVNNQAGTDGYGRPDSVSNLTRTSCMVGDLSGYPVRWLAIGY